MRYIETPPPPDLAPSVHCVWELEGDGSVLSEPIFPDGRAEIVVHLGDRPGREPGGAPQPAAMVVGQMTTALRLRPGRRVHSIGVRFTPAGARAFLHVPLHELTGRVEPLDAVRSGPASLLWSVVSSSRTPAERATLVFASLRRTTRSTPARGHVQRAVACALACRGRSTVDAMARAAGTSGRHLERLFLDEVGLPPKTFARIVRFQRALRDLQKGVPAAHAAAACGFADQSHLAREFKRVAGVPARDVDFPRVVFVQDEPVRPAAD